MVTLVPMGYGVTDENGVAKLDHDMEGNVLSHSYTGVGAGRIDLLASIDDPDNVSYSGEGTLVSETYEVLDAMFYDQAVTGHKNSNWTNRNNLMEITTNDSYTLIKAPTSSYGLYTASGTYSDGLCVEFKFYYQSNADCYINVLGASFNLKTYCGEDCSVKILVNNGTATFYKNNVPHQTSKSISATSVYFQINSGGANIGYSNFKIYPI